MRKFEVLSKRAQNSTKTPHNSGNGMETIKTTLFCEMALCQRTGKTTNCCNFGRHLFLRAVDVAGIWFCLKIGYPVPLNPVLSKKINVLKWLVVSDRHISFKDSLSVYWNGGLIGPIAKFAERTSKALSSSS